MELTDVEIWISKNASVCQVFVCWVTNAMVRLYILHCHITALTHLLYVVLHLGISQPAATQHLKIVKELFILLYCSLCMKITALEGVSQDEYRTWLCFMLCLSTCPFILYFLYTLAGLECFKYNNFYDIVLCMDRLKGPSVLTFP